MTLFLLKRIDLGLFWGTIQTKGRSIGVGIGMALLLKFGLGIYALILRSAGISLTDDATLGMLSINDDIIAVNQFYHPAIGFLMVVILVPIYEEILFRGVFLSACEKHMKFFIANCLQAIAFALVHQELKLIPFYFAFAFVCGHYRNKTQSLATGISLHVTNNLLAFIGILILQGRMG
jgi:membrane protease YdiL (CAAX protease family)